MKISLDWLKDHIEIKDPVSELSDILTDVGLEIEGVQKIGIERDKLQGLIVGRVLEILPHPNADKLRICKVDIGGGDVQSIICGAPNIEKDHIVVVAPPGSTIYPTGHEPVKIKKARIRGEESSGMICSEAELGISDNHDGILVLSDDLSAGEDFSKVFNPVQDTVFEIGLTPNRGDAASHLGVARDLKAYYRSELKKQVYPKIKGGSGSDLKVILENPEMCPRYAGVVLEGLTPKESPEWLKNRLRALDLVPINSVVDVTNYILHDLGQPLHAFDLDKINGNKIVVRAAKKGEKLLTLDEVERKLDQGDLMICDANDPMCIGGVFGGLNSGVSESTTSIFLESACFDPGTIRRTALRHQLKTDAAYRFERGTDPDNVVVALEKAVELFKEIHGAKVVSELFDLYPDPIERKRIKVDKEKFWINIGHKVDEKEVVSILEKLDFEILSDDAEKWELGVPNYRTEVTEDADVYEEFLRIYGFNNIPIGDEIGSTYFAHFEEDSIDEFNHNALNFFRNNGFWEAMNISISNPEQQTIAEKGFDQKGVELLNPLSADLSHMRISLLPGILQSLQHNVNRKQENNRLVEKGKVYSREGKGYEEIDTLGIAIEGMVEEESWQNVKRNIDIPQIIQVTGDFLRSIGLGDYHIVEANEAIFESGGYTIFNGNGQKKDNAEPIGNLGLIQKGIRERYDLPSAVAYAELSIPALYGLFKRGSTDFQELSKYPLVKRDLSLVIKEEVGFAEVREIVEKRLGEYLRSLNCFSIFRGKPLDEGMKSYAISFQLERMDRTFKDQEIDNLMEGLIKDFENKINATIRR